MFKVYYKSHQEIEKLNSLIVIKYAEFITTNFPQRKFRLSAFSDEAY
jgi:hypothetical protein